MKYLDEYEYLKHQKHDTNATRVLASSAQYIVHVCLPAIPNLFLVWQILSIKCLWQSAIRLNRTIKSIIIGGHMQRGCWKTRYQMYEQPLPAYRKSHVLTLFISGQTTCYDVRSCGIIISFRVLTAENSNDCYKIISRKKCILAFANLFATTLIVPITFNWNFFSSKLQNLSSLCYALKCFITLAYVSSK